MMRFQVTLRDQRSEPEARQEDLDCGIFEVDDYTGVFTEDECVDYLLSKLSRLVNRVE